MSLPGPPPPIEEGEPAPEWVRHTGVPGEGAFQETLQELNESWSDPETRWTAVKFLRLVRLRIENHPVEFSQLRKCPPKYRAVFQVGRLSVVAAKTGIARVRANPLHIDIDWFGSEPTLPHWWNLADATVGKGFELDSLVKLLHFLEKSFGLASSGVAPADWSWSPGDSYEDWGNMHEALAPAVAADFEKLFFEWHRGRNPDAIVPEHDENKFWWSTPWTSREFDF